MLKKTLELIRKYKVEVIVGLISSFIWMHVQNFLSAIPAIGRGFLKYFSDLPYRSAAIELENLALALFTSLIVYVAFGIAMASLIANLRAALKTKGLIKQVRSDVQNPEKARAAVKAAKKTQNLGECIDELQKASNKSLAACIIKVFFTVVCCVVLHLSCIKPIQMRIGFTNAIKIITPYTDEHTIDKLESDWALMKTKEDYMAIDKAITEIRDSNDLW